VLSQNNGLLSPENLVSCDIQDPAYTNFGPHWSLFLNASNAAHIFQWHNGLWRKFAAAAGGYPHAVWDQALKSLGVQEHLVVVEDNE
jgi:hypothetical protein